MEYFLKSERLGFRCWREDDLPFAISLWGDPEVAVMMGTPATAEAAGARLTKEIAQLRDAGMQYWAAFLLDGNEFAGCAGLRPHEKGPHIFELGYHLRPALWGRGLATEAARTVIDYGFETLGAETLFAGHHPSNDKSRRVLLKLGFKYAGDEVYPPTGWIEPTYLLQRR